MRIPQTGGCICGAARYEITQEPIRVYTCHCTDCQRVTVSAFSIGVAVPGEAFRLTGKELTPAPGDSSDDGQHAVELCHADLALDDGDAVRWAMPWRCRSRPVATAEQNQCPGDVAPGNTAGQLVTIVNSTDDPQEKRRNLRQVIEASHPAWRPRD